MRKRPASVFVPYEKHPSGIVERSAAFPRFPEAHQVVEFLQSKEGAARTSGRLLDWREEWEPDSIAEYMSGVGEKGIAIPELIKVSFAALKRSSNQNGGNS